MSRLTNNNVDIDAIIAMRKTGSTYAEIMEVLGCTKSAIEYHCRNEGLTEESNYANGYGGIKESIIAMRKDNKTYDEIANVLGCTKSSVAFHCKNAGLNNMGSKNIEISKDTITKIKELTKTNTVMEVVGMLGISRTSVKKYKDKTPTKTKIVMQFTRDKVFVNSYDSGKIASTKTGIAQSSIRNACNGQKKGIAGGYYWEYSAIN